MSDNPHPVTLMTEGPMYQLAHGILDMFPNAVVTKIDSNELIMTDSPNIFDADVNIIGDAYSYGHYIHVSMNGFGSVMAGLIRTVCENGFIQIHANQDISIPSLGEFNASERLHIVGTYLRAVHMRQEEQQRETVLRMERAATSGLNPSSIANLLAIVNSRGSISHEIRSQAVLAITQMSHDNTTLLGFITLATELSEHHLSLSAAHRVSSLVRSELQNVSDLPRVVRQGPMPALFLPQAFPK